MQKYLGFVDYSALCNLAAQSTLSAAVFSLLLFNSSYGRQFYFKVRLIQIQNGLAMFARLSAIKVQ